MKPESVAPYITYLWFFLMLGAVLAGGIIRRKTDTDADRRSDLITIAMLWLAPNIAIRVLHLIDSITPNTVDAALLAIDGRLGLSPVAVARNIYAHPWLFRFFVETYHSYSLAVGIIWAAERNKTLRRGWIIGLALCPIFYWLVPAVGPMASLVDFPYTSTLGRIDPLAWRNCFPSMHISWPLLALLFIKNRILWVGVAVYFVLTCIATIALGQHYFIDLIAAVPFCYAVRAIARLEFWRTLPFLSAVPETES